MKWKGEWSRKRIMEVGIESNELPRRLFVVLLLAIKILISIGDICVILIIIYNSNV
jgi:hypothetical protein